MRTFAGGQQRYSKLCLVDLAGSERQDKVSWLYACADLDSRWDTTPYGCNLQKVRMRGCLQTAAEGLTAEEGKQINKSLSALGNVIGALTGNPLHPDFCMQCLCRH